MRLTPEYQKCLTNCAFKLFGADTEVWLFGSRVEDNAKGGDIDLLIKLATPVADKAVLAAKYSAMLQMQLGLQKIDVIVIDPKTQLLPIHQQALQNGIKL